MRATLTTLAEVAGIGLVSAGSWLILPALGLIVAGIGLAAIGFLAAD